MNEAWPTNNLGDVCHIVGGGTPAKNNQDFYTGNIPWATVRDMNKEAITSTEFSITNDAVKGSSTNVIPGGNVIIATRVGLGKVCMLGQNTAINQDLRGIIPKSKKNIDVGFLFWWLKSIAHRIEEEGTGATVKGVKLPFIKSLQTPLPPLPEQKRIVAILDEAFEGIATAVANTEKNLANARELFENYLNTVFTQKGDGWVEKALSEVCSITSKLVDPRDPGFIDLPHIGAGNMVSKTGELVEIKTAREEGLKSGKFGFDGKMVLYSKIRPYLKKACIPNFRGLCSADVYPLSPNLELLDRNFLFHLLMSRHFTDYAIAGSDRAGMPKVNRDHLFRYRVVLPDVSEQQRIATNFDNLSRETMQLEAIYQSKLAALAELKQSILQKAFAGELTTLPDKATEEAVA